jgi:isoamylase
VSYNHKHNDANLEGNRDGTDDNRSWNCGTEGETDDPEVNALRERQQRNFLATLLLSQGAPMLLGGDEIARTQGGNNNGWCQDNEISWFDWELDERAQRQLEWAQRLIALRRAHPVFHRRDFLTGESRDGSLPDAWWFRPDGRRMTQQDWNAGAQRLGLFLNGEQISAPGPVGERVEDDSFLLLFNASGEDVGFSLPSRRFGKQWQLVLRTADPGADSVTVPARGALPLVARSMALLRRVD